LKISFLVNDVHLNDKPILSELEYSELEYVVALDQGTTSSRAMILDKNAQIVAIAQRELTQIYPQSGWVEHDPLEIYASQTSTLVEALAQAQISASQVAAIGITNQRETTIVWDKLTGKPIYNAIVWQCRRTAHLCEQLKARGLEAMVREKTGLLLDPYFSATKLIWILDHVAGARELARANRLLFGTVDSWLVWKMTQGQVHVTDYTNASRTMLFNINTLEWDGELLEHFDIPRSMMPEVKPSSMVYGHLTLEGLGGVQLPIAGIAGDQQAALFGQMCVLPGQAKNTYGTGCFVLMNTGQEKVVSHHGLLTTLACGPSGEPTYALEGSVFMAGAAVQWLRDELKLIRNAQESEQLATQVDSSNGVYVVPAFTGLGAPYWEPYACGTIVGLRRGSNHCHIVRATLESIAYQTLDVIKAMQADSGICIPTLRVDGGGVANQFLMQFQADILDRAVERPVVTEVTALGAAYLAGLAVGFWAQLKDLEGKSRIDKIFSPSSNQSKREQRYRGWQRAVATAQVWASLHDDDDLLGVSPSTSTP
jgi:glycerol kinase